MKKILLFIIFLSGVMFSQQLTGDNPYGTEFRKDPLNYRALPTVFYSPSDSTWWNVSHVDGVLVIQSTVTDTSLGSDIVTVNNSEVFHYTPPVDILPTTNLDTDSTQILIDLQSYPLFTLDVLASGGVTYKVFITNRTGASATNPYDGNWHDYSTTFLGAATKVDADGYYIQDTPVPGLKIMLKIWTTDATNDFSAVIIKRGL